MTFPYQNIPLSSRICSANVRRRTMREDGFTLDGVERTPRGGVSNRSFRTAIAQFLQLSIGNCPGSYIERYCKAIEIECRRKGYGLLDLTSHRTTGQFSTEQMRQIAAIVGFDVHEMWPDAPQQTLSEYLASQRMMSEAHHAERQAAQSEAVQTAAPLTISDVQKALDDLWVPRFIQGPLLRRLNGGAV